MAITPVNSSTGLVSGSAVASITFSLPAGLAQNDVVLVATDTAGGNANRTFSESTGLWTKLADLYGDGSSVDANLGIFAKRMGSTPDSSITVSISAGSGQWSAIALAYRGVDTGTLLDTAVVTATGTGSANPDPAPPAITTVTAGAEVVLFGGSGENTGTVTFPSGFSTFQVDVPGTSPNNRTVSASKNQASPGTVTPGTFDISTAVTTRGIAAASIALRPAPAVTTITGTGFADADAFGAGALRADAILSGTGFADPDAFGAGSVSAVTLISGTGFDDPDEFGAGAVMLEQAIEMVGFEDPDYFGTGGRVIKIFDVPLETQSKVLQVHSALDRILGVSMIGFGAIPGEDSIYSETPIRVTDHLVETFYSAPAAHRPTYTEH